MNGYWIEVWCASNGCQVESDFCETKEDLPVDVEMIENEDYAGNFSICYGSDEEYSHRFNK